MNTLQRSQYAEIPQYRENTRLPATCGLAHRSQASNRSTMVEKGTVAMKKYLAYTTWIRFVAVGAAVWTASAVMLPAQEAADAKPTQQGRTQDPAIDRRPGTTTAKRSATSSRRLLEKTGRFEVTRVQDDLDALLPDRIAPFKLVVFYWTLGEINDAQKRGLLNHIASGNGFATCHSGADSFRGDPEYRALVGGYFVTHPSYRTYQVSVAKTDSPITRGIDEFMITDEQYIVDYDPRVSVLANGLYQGRAVPVVWTKDWGKGRVFYNALGHDPKACEQEMFQTLFVRGTSGPRVRSKTRRIGVLPVRPPGSLSRDGQPP